MDDLKVFPMAMSLGWNPFYKNERLTAVRREAPLRVYHTYLSQQEVHIMHDFATDFYGYELRVLVLGYIRPELDYISRGNAKHSCILAILNVLLRCTNKRH
jgi:riboflavin kinase